ncbi:MAG: hypothetical protein ACRD8K_02745 [Nitrososphaeraceae archaeon]
MKIPKWICNICKQTLTRKWNAKRHCDNKHYSLYDSIIPFREYLVTTSNISPILPPHHNDYQYKINNNSNQLPFQENLLSYQDKSTTIPKISSYWQRSIPQQEDMIADDFTKREELLSNTLDRIAPKYEEIKNLLSHLPEPTKTQMVGGLLSNAIASDNPIRFINKQLKVIRKAKFYNNMLEDASVFLGSDKRTTKEYLKMRLKEDSLD